VNSRLGDGKHGGENGRKSTGELHNAECNECKGSKAKVRVSISFVL